MSAVTLRNICKRFGSTEIIRNVNLDIQDNEFVVFVGPSGCGKSTLLRLIAGLEEITSGEMLIGNRKVNELPPAKRGISMVFQSYALYPHMSIYDNIAFGLKQTKGGSASDIEERVKKAAEILQITHLLNRKPKELSGGQRQRVAIGRAIVRQPEVFLFDEPLSNLDASLRVQMRIEIARLKKELATTMIYVTHDQVEAMTLADKIVVLRAGQIEQVGSPLELYHHPRNQFVAGFLGSPNMNFLNSKIAAVKDNTVTIQLASTTITMPVKTLPNVRQGEEITLGIRPEHLSLSGECSDTHATIEGKVFVTEQLGGETYIYLRLENDNTLVVRGAGDAAVRAGDIMQLALPANNCHLFTSDGLNLTASA